MKEVQRTTMSVLFFCRKGRLLKNGEAPIFMRITVNKQFVETRIKRSVLVESWSQVKECVIGKNKEANV